MGQLVLARLSLHALFIFRNTMKCAGCLKSPEEIYEYQSMAEQEEMLPSEFVRYNEGTYNSKADTFYCTDCYIKAGQPLGVAPALKG